MSSSVPAAPTPSPVAIVTDEVRARIRAENIDPLRQPQLARELVHSAVIDHERRALAGSVPAFPDRSAAVREVWDQVAGFGPLQVFFDDPTVEEIWINDPARVFIARGGSSILTTVVLTAQEVRDLVERMLAWSGRRVDLSSPFVDAALPDGSRLHVVIPDITRSAWAVNVRKFVVRSTRLAELVELGTLDVAAARLLTAVVEAGLNIVVSGGTHAGKTTMLSCLLGAVPARERVITCEEVFELRVPRRDTVAMQCRPAGLEGGGEVSLRRLVTEALRMRPDRLVVGEVRQAESLDLLIALNSGVPGMVTVHANSAREALLKMCILPLLASENISDRFVVPTVASCVDVIVHVDLDTEGRRRVLEIVAVSGRVEEATIEAVDLFRRDGDRLVRGGGRPPHPERFAARGIDLDRLAAEDDDPLPDEPSDKLSDALPDEPSDERPDVPPDGLPDVQPARAVRPDPYREGRC